MHVLAVDWSGAADERGEKLWWAEAADGELLALAPATRRAVVDLAVAMAAADPELLVGVDAAFSYPAWFVRERFGGDVRALWAGRDAIDATGPPFWGWKGSRKPLGVVVHRRAEWAASPSASSPFQVNGAGAVGAGTLAVLPHLAELDRAGWAIWPFDRPGGGRPTIVEVWPRRFVGRVSKERFLSREAWWDAHAPEVGGRLRARALSSSDAFDAAVTALAMSTRTPADLLRVPDVAEVAVEGWIAGVPPR